jgi:serine/threonine protein kinase, bacterial
MTPKILNNRYQILRELADGGFGKTFLAEDTLMPSGRRCVVKQLKPIGADPQIAQWVQDKFQREAALLEDLGDRNDQIPRLYAYFSEDSNFYLVEEWVQGQTLTDKVKQEGMLSETKVKDILVDVLRVLEYIQGKGIIHRDIKPDNIILRFADGKPVLIDFGAVKETMGTVITSSGRSTSSVIIGTPGYMPSEQSAGRPVFASDLYSLGLAAIYLLTNRQPQELQTDVQTGNIMWRQYAPNISSSFAEIIDRAIQPHARDRYLNAKSMLEAVQSISATPSTVPDTLIYPKNNNTPNNAPVSPSGAQTVPLEVRLEKEMGTFGNQHQNPSNPHYNPTSYGNPSKNGNKNLFILGGIGLASVLGLAALVATQPDLLQQIRGTASTPESTTASTPTPESTPTSTPTYTSEDREPKTYSTPPSNPTTKSNDNNDEITRSWSKYEAYDNSYTVSFPYKPTEKKDYLDTAIGKVYFVEASYFTNNDYYSTSHTTYPVAPSEYDPQKGLDGSRDGISKSINMSIVREEKITINGFPAREVEMKGTSGALLAHLILDPNGPTLYQVFVVSSNGNVNTAENKAFINSFKLQRK